MHSGGAGASTGLNGNDISEHFNVEYINVPQMDPDTLTVDR